MGVGTSWLQPHSAFPKHSHTEGTKEYQTCISDSNKNKNESERKLKIELCKKNKKKYEEDLELEKENKKKLLNTLNYDVNPNYFKCSKEKLDVDRQRECVDPYSYGKCRYPTLYGVEIPFISGENNECSERDAEKQRECNEKYDLYDQCNNNYDFKQCSKDENYIKNFNKCRGCSNSKKNLNEECTDKKKKTFFSNIIDKMFSGQIPFEFIYYLFTFFASLLQICIFLTIVWIIIIFLDWLFYWPFSGKDKTLKEFASTTNWDIQAKIVGGKIDNNKDVYLAQPVYNYKSDSSGNNKELIFKYLTPFRPIYLILSIYFKYIHRPLTLFALIVFMILAGVTILLYFLNKLVNWWPASMVWDILGVFKGSKTTFKFYDDLFGCNTKGLVLGFGIPCHMQNFWTLTENWIVDTCKKDIGACYNMSEDEIRDYINMHKPWGGNLGHAYIREGFENYENEKNIKKPDKNIKDFINKYNNKKLVEEFYSLSDKANILRLKAERENKNNEKQNDKGDKQRKKYSKMIDESEDDDEDDED